jgi:glycosyltransferase involved in cell wall biosynthesis
MSPKVSVLLPVYNAGPFLRQAIDSILNQSFADFELIIIDDGSTDNSGETIATYTDQRIKAFHQENQGLMATLNRGLGLTQGEYIARMDQDDISFPERFQKQVAFLDTHPDHAIVGTTYAYVDPQNQLIGVYPALLDDQDLRRDVVTKSPFGHGSVMMRASVIRDNSIEYRPSYIEDHDLWMRLAAYGKMANLSDILYLWRHHPGSIMALHNEKQRKASFELQEAFFPKLNIAELSAWPGWRQLLRYHNERITLWGKSLRVLRRNAYSSMYLNLAILFARHNRIWPALKTLCFAFFAQPFYPPLALWRRLTTANLHEDQLSQ